MCESAAGADVDAAVLESYLSQIKELLPDYGDGFLAACLQARSPWCSPWDGACRHYAGILWSFPE